MWKLRKLRIVIYRNRFRNRFRNRKTFGFYLIYDNRIISSSLWSGTMVSNGLQLQFVCDPKEVDQRKMNFFINTISFPSFPPRQTSSRHCPFQYLHHSKPPPKSPHSTCRLSPFSKARRAASPSRAPPLSLTSSPAITFSSE